MTTSKAAFVTSLTVDDLPEASIRLTLGEAVHNIVPNPRLSANGNPMLFAVGKVTDSDGNRYQANIMLTRIDDSPEAVAFRKANRK